MKLTKTHKEDFVSSVMADVPKEDYKTKINDVIQKKVKEKLAQHGMESIPIERLCRNSTSIHYYELWNEGGVYSATKPKNTSKYYSRWVISVCFPGLLDNEIIEIKESKAVTSLVQKYLEQDQKLKDLEKRVTTLLSNCNTLKQAIVALPEFVKYLPKEPVTAPHKEFACCWQCGSRAYKSWLA